MKCPSCGAAELIHETRDLPYVYKGERTTIPDVTGDHCPACGEVLLNDKAGEQYVQSVLALLRTPDASRPDR